MVRFQQNLDFGERYLLRKGEANAKGDSTTLAGLVCDTLVRVRASPLLLRGSKLARASPTGEGIEVKI
ncbi:hypothetical protein [Nostoc sp.]|uniref:hypothetical protein n=1 Tax=Nostoc sp. TaxID=1180 RepID=UPI002FFA7B07